MAVKQQFFPGLQALRVGAAALVLVCHTIYVASGNNVAPFQIWLGRSGVMLFFAISGFVIALQRNKPVVDFIKHRALRIYPAYWIALALEAAIFAALGIPVGVSIDELLLYPAMPERLVTAIPYWTLVFEVTFYLVAALLFSMRLTDRRLTIIAAVWIIAINAIGPSALNEAGFCLPGASILMSPAMQVLPLGLICGINFVRLQRSSRVLLIATAAVAFAASFFLPDLSHAFVLALGIGSASLILAVADCAVPAMLRRLGDASYGIYLIHFPVLVALSPAAGLLGLTAIASVCGTLYGLFEYWLYGALTRRTERPAYDKITSSIARHSV
jgi:peptidoglycan/LPS O-acetylase OafA/YrhL